MSRPADLWRVLEETMTDIDLLARFAVEGTRYRRRTVATVTAKPDPIEGWR